MVRQFVPGIILVLLLVFIFLLKQMNHKISYLPQDKTIAIQP